MDTTTAAKNLVTAIGDFAGAYADDPRFSDLVSSLREAEGQVEKLVPGAADKADRESPGRRSAREAAEEAAERSRQRASARTGADADATT